jgi:uncharacterized protein (DUF1499 family)
VFPARPVRLSPAALVLSALAASTLACGAKVPDPVGRPGLAPCPSTPNCVSSLEAPGTPAHIEPLWVIGPPEAAWAVASDVVAAAARVEIVALTDDALHAEATSLLFRFVDDVELRLHRGEGRIDVRSASRVGRSDLGVNRRRIERLRQDLVERGVVASRPPHAGQGD